MAPRGHDTSVALVDRPRQETVGAFMSVDKGSNQVHYMQGPYRPHLQLSLERGARSGMAMDAKHGRQTSPRSEGAAQRSPEKAATPRHIYFMQSLQPTATAGLSSPRTTVASRTAFVPPKKNLYSTSPRPGPKLAAGERRKQFAGYDDHPSVETAGGTVMSIDRGTNQVHYLTKFKPHVQLSLERGARSGMDKNARAHARAHSHVAGRADTQAWVWSLTR